MGVQFSLGYFFLFAKQKSDHFANYDLWKTLLLCSGACFSVGGMILSPRSEAFAIALALETGTTGVALNLTSCSCFFIVICHLGKFKSLTPSSCWIEKLLVSFPSFFPAAEMERGKVLRRSGPGGICFSVLSPVSLLWLFSPLQPLNTSTSGL